MMRMQDVIQRQRDRMQATTDQLTTVQNSAAAAAKGKVKKARNGVNQAMADEEAVMKKVRTRL